MKKRILYWIAIMLLATGCALQTDVTNLEERMALIEQRNYELAKENDSLKGKVVETNENQKKLGEKDQHTKNTYASLHANVESLNDEIRLINGRIDETAYLIKQEIGRIESSKSNDKDSLVIIQQEIKIIQTRLARLENYLNFKNEKTDSFKKSSKSSPEKVESDSILFDSARSAFDSGNFELASSEYRKLLKLYPKSRYADDAQFWIGEAYFQEKWYEKAIIEYEKVIETYPKGDKVTAAMLKQGLSFKELGDDSSARIILRELINQHPKSSEAEIAKRTIEEIKP